MLSTVAKTIRRRALCAAGDRVAVAISGGADSVALALAVRALARRGGPGLAGLIHVNHGLRGAESDADEAFCRALAARWDCRLESTRIDVHALAAARGCSIEAAAREARYDYFAAAAARLEATLVATGHTRDDQAETVLLRLLRGAGTQGLSGIRPKRGIYIRPLIDVSRDAVRRYLAAQGESWKEDASNADLAVPRNRIRHELLPVLAGIAPRVSSALARLADLAADDNAVLMAGAIEMLPALVLSRSGTSVKVDAGRLALMPAALARRVVRTLVQELAPGASPGAGHIEAVRLLASTDTSKGPLDLPGITASRSGGVLTLARAGSRIAKPVEPVSFSRPLPVPGSVSIPEAAVTVTARVATGLDGEMSSPDPWRAVVQRSAVLAPLIVRSRRPGDRIRPLGAPGRRKLQDLMVDRKIPRAERDLVPVVEDAEGRILWVAGVAMAEEGRITTPEAGVVILELRKDQ